MIPQISGKLFLILLICFYFNTTATAQKKTSSDTIVLYETQIVYDTLYIYDTIRIPKPINHIPAHLKYADTLSIPLPKDASIIADTILANRNKNYLGSLTLLKPLNVNFLIPTTQKYHPNPEKVFCKSPATNFKKDIIYSKSDSRLMKKENYISKSQNNSRFGISAGGGIWWAQSSNSSMRSNTVPSANVGFFYENRIIGKVSLKAGLNYSWLLKKGITFSNEAFMGNHSDSLSVSSNYAHIFNWDINGKNESESSFSHISIPLKVSYSIKFVQPYIGLEYKYLMQEGNNKNAFNALAGLDIHLSKNLSLAINYSYGLKAEFERMGTVEGTTVGNMVVQPGSVVLFFPYPVQDYISNQSGSFFGQRIDCSLYLNLQRIKNK